MHAAFLLATYLTKLRLLITRLDLSIKCTFYPIIVTINFVQGEQKYLSNLSKRNAEMQIRHVPAILFQLY